MTATHGIEITVRVFPEDMDGTPEQSAEIMLALVDEALGNTMATWHDTEVTRCWTVVDDPMEWEQTYKPLTETGVELADSWGARLFETYGDDMKTVLDVVEKEPRRVWTLVDGDDGSYIVNGFRLVNRIGYYITKVEWQQGDRIEIEYP